MASGKDITRRAAIVAGFGGAGWLIANANGLTVSPSFAKVFQTVEDWTKTAQRGLLHPQRLAREYSPAGLSPYFRPTGTFDPGTDDYKHHAAQQFANRRLKNDGQVDNPLKLS